MKRAILASFVAVFLIPVICHAENWYKFFTTYTSKSNVTLSYDNYYDTDSVNYIGNNTVQVWYKNGNMMFSQNGTPLTTTGGPLFAQTELKEFDCPQRRYKILTGSISNGLETKSLNEFAYQAWRYPEPGSEDEALYKIVCKLK